jgi:hypothetical protein
MTGRYVKTAAGREAIHGRVHTLSRPARNLLLVIDGSRTGAEWVALVGGSSEADLAQLLQAGLVEPSGALAAAPALPPAAPRVRATGLEQALAALSYRDLYDRLTGEARARLGLIKGYRMVLEIEKCSGAEEIRKLALRFIGEVRAAQGDEAARKLSRDLGADV